MSDGWDRFWGGKTGAAGEAMLGQNLSASPPIQSFWREVLAGRDAGIAILDLACGAGSVLKVALALDFENLTGVDYSAEAIRKLAGSLTEIKAVQASARETGLPDESFDLIVSQFGFEYAGAELCAGEIARLLRPGGEFTALAHIDGGGIHAEVSGKVAEINLIRETEFIARSQDAATALKAHDAEVSAESAQALGVAAKAFTEAEVRLAEFVKTHPRGTAAHLYRGTRQLLARRTAYDLADITGWLDGMADELDATMERLQAMRAAALDEAGLNACLQAFEAAGLSTAPGDTLTLPQSPLPAAWIIRAEKA